MTYTLFDATLDLARILTDVWESSAVSSGSNGVSALYDSEILHQDGFFGNSSEDGVLWLKLSTPASKRITDQTADILTFEPAQASSIVSGDRYAASSPEFPKYVLVQAINNALREIGTVPNVKDVTATADQETYDADDDSVFDYEIMAIEEATDDEAPYYWKSHTCWNQIPLSATSRQLVFWEDHIPAYAHTLRIHYLEPVSEVYQDADEINAQIEPDLVKWKAAIHAIRWKMQRTERDKPHWEKRLDEAQQQAALTMANYPIKRHKRPRGSKW